MDDDELIEEARSSIGNYCSDVCKSICCSDGFLIIKPEEIDAVMQGKTGEYETSGLLSKNKAGNYQLVLGKSGFPCPSLDTDFRCKVYNDPKRPALCKDFPIFVFGYKIVTSPKCPAVFNGILDKYFDLLRKKGYEIV